MTKMTRMLLVVAGPMMMIGACGGPPPVDGVLEAPTPAAGRRRSERERAAPDELDAAGRALFEALRRHRLEVARAEGVPPYVVASDRTLREIAGLRPSNALELEHADRPHRQHRTRLHRHAADHHHVHRVAVGGQFGREAAGDDVDEHATARHLVKGGGHLRRDGRRDEARAISVQAQSNASHQAASAAATLRPRALLASTSVMRWTAPRSSSFSTTAISRAMRSSAAS